MIYLWIISLDNFKRILSLFVCLFFSVGSKNAVLNGKMLIIQIFDFLK